MSDLQSAQHLPSPLLDPAPALHREHVRKPKRHSVRVARYLRAHSHIGLAVGAGVFLMTSVLDLLSPSNPVRDPVSELALDRAGAWVSLAFIISGVAFLALAVALGDAVRSRHPSWPQTTLILLGGSGAILLGVFPTDATITPSTMFGRLHSVAAALGFVALCLGLLVTTRRMQDDAEWYHPNRRLRPLAWIALGLLVTTAVALAYARATHDPWQGLIGGTERLLIATLLAWALVASLRLRQVVAVAR